MAKRSHQRNIWLDMDFIDILRDLKRQKSAKEKRDYSDADISKFIIHTPAFEEVKNQLLKDDDSSFMTQIKIKMDKRLI